MGHDLRTPLTSIGLDGPFAASARPAGRARHQRSTASSAAPERMTKMILNCSISHALAWGVGFRSSRCPPICARYSKASSRSSKPPIRLEVEGDVTGTWDADRLAEALSNIAGNAVEHASPGTPVVVKARAEGQESSWRSAIMGNPFPKTCFRSSSSPSARRSTRNVRRGTSASASTSPANRALGQRHARRLLHRRQDDVFHAPAPLCPVPDPPSSKAEK